VKRDVDCDVDYIFLYFVRSYRVTSPGVIILGTIPRSVKTNKNTFSAI
jgi:hypothetical protein